MSEAQKTVNVNAPELALMAELARALPAVCRQAFTLRKVRGLSQRDVARHMGISENTVEKHIGKALRFLMSAFGANAQEGNATGSPDKGQRRAHR